MSHVRPTVGSRLDLPQPARPAKWHVSMGELRLVGAPASLDAARAVVARHRRAACPSRLDARRARRARERRSPTSLAALRDAGLDAIATARLDRLEPEHLEPWPIGRTAAAVGDARHARRRRRAARPARGAARVAGRDRCRARLCAAAGRDVAPSSPPPATTTCATWRSRVSCSTTSRTSRRTGRAWARSCRSRACCSAPTTSTPCPRATTCRTARAARSSRKSVATSPAASLEAVERDGAFRPRGARVIRIGAVGFLNARPLAYGLDRDRPRVAAPRPAVGVRAVCCTRARSTSASCR